MEIAPDLAEKVLAAETRNAIQAVSEGGTLPAEQRRRMTRIAITPQSAAEMRVGALVERWASGGALSASEIAEVRQIHPDFAGASSALLVAETPTPARYTSDDFDRWTNLYGRDKRQVRRWVQLGKDRNDPCPLDDPARMPGWWSRNMKWRVPDEMLAAARDAALPSPPAAASDAALQAPSTSVPDPATPGTPPALPVLDLASMGLDASEDIFLARSLVAAAGKLLQDAYAGKGGDVDLLQRRYEKARKNQREVEASAREEAKAKDKLVPVDIVRHDLARAIEMLRQMRESMPRRIKELYPDIPEPVWQRLAPVIAMVREQEERIFCNLDSIKNLADVFELIAA